VFRLAKPEDFFKALSRSPRSKFILAWATFAGLVIPSALLMSFGVPEQYVLPGLLVAIPLFQYAVFCIFPVLNRSYDMGDRKISANAFLPSHDSAIDFFVATKPGEYSIFEVKGVGKTTSVANALAQTWGIPTLRSSVQAINLTIPTGSLTVSGVAPVVVMPEYQQNIVAGLNFREAEKKTRDEMIKLQRKQLETDEDLSPLPLPQPSAQYG
jgi:hypothetical protein